MTERKRQENSLRSIVLAALLNGVSMLVITLVAFWFAATYGSGPVRPPMDTLLLVTFPVAVMLATAWSRRPGQPRQGIWR
jgi:Co/Zn/Cd efflux system component